LNAFRIYHLNTCISEYLTGNTCSNKYFVDSKHWQHAASREVQLLIELKVNETVLECLPKLRANNASSDSFGRVMGAARLRDVDDEKLAEA
jgi:hypothetical protein